VYTHLKLKKEGDSFFFYRFLLDISFLKIMGVDGIGITILSVTPSKGPLALSVGMSQKMDSPPTGTVHVQQFPYPEVFWPQDHRYVHFSLRLRLTMPLPYTLGRMGVQMAPCSNLLEESVVVLQSLEKIRNKHDGCVLEEKIGRVTVKFKLRVARAWRDNVVCARACTPKEQFCHRPSFLPALSHESYVPLIRGVISPDTSEDKPPSIPSASTEPQTDENKDTPRSTADLSPRSRMVRSQMYRLEALNNDKTMGWCPSAGSKFNLRVGPNYMKAGNKAPSPPAIYDVIFCDVIKCPHYIPHAVNRIVPPPKTFLGDAPRRVNDIPPYFVINFSLPHYGPLEWGASEETTTIIAIGRLSEQARNLPPDDPGLELWRAYIASGNEERLENSSTSKLLKVLVRADNLNELSVPAMAQPTVNQFNGKPVLLQKETTIRTEDNWVELSTNGSKLRGIARASISKLKGTIACAKISIGMTIQGVEDHELPERALVGFSIQNYDMLAAAPLLE